MWRDAVWLKLPERQTTYDIHGRFALFRLTQTLPADCRLQIDISANSRYRLWVNEQSVLSGPCKGDTFRQYYETVDLTAYLREGVNVFAVQVLYVDANCVESQTDERACIYGVMSQPCGHRLAVQGDVFDREGRVVCSVTTGQAPWLGILDDSYYLKSSAITCFLGAVCEEIDCSRGPSHWREITWDAHYWRAAVPTVPVLPAGPLYLAGVQPRFRMQERPIPLLFERPCHFERAFTLPDGEAVQLPLTVPARGRVGLVLDAGEIVNGYPRYVFRRGDGTVRIVYFEKFGGPGSDLRRDDYVHGNIEGLTDTVELCGVREVYEPFWMRSFRFVYLELSSGDLSVTLDEASFKRTGYPLSIDSAIRSSVGWVGQLWQICLNTLQNCMAETYMDCPGFEQLQFAMDTRLEALFTYAVSSDAALARKALIDFHYGMQPEGLTTGKYPSAYLQILSTFSLHYIYMLDEYAVQTGDEETVRLCRCDVDRILDYYDAHRTDSGLVGRLGYWEFVDWQDAWAEHAGMPTALQQGSSTIINLMYAYALQCGARIFRRQGRRGLAEEYDARCLQLLETIQRTCYNPDRGLYWEGPQYEQYTQHAQAWAVLCGLVEGEQARALLERTVAAPDCLPVTFSTAYEWVRAIALVGMEQEIRTGLDAWIELLEKGCTACPETPQKARSDCHAWSALPILVYVRYMAGITETAPGEIQIAPHLFDLPDLSGQVITSCGPVSFCYTRTPTGLSATLQIPTGAHATYSLPDGQTTHLTAGTHTL